MLITLPAPTLSLVSSCRCALRPARFSVANALVSGWPTTRGTPTLTGTATTRVTVSPLLTIWPAAGDEVTTFPAATASLG